MFNLTWANYTLFHFDAEMQPHPNLNHWQTNEMRA